MDLSRTLHIKIDPKMLEMVRKVADGNGISIAAWIRILLDNQLKDPRPISMEEGPKRRRTA